jgi:hypothetical protein
MQRIEKLLGQSMESVDKLLSPSMEGTNKLLGQSMYTVCEEWGELKLSINADDKLSDFTKGG